MGRPTIQEIIKKALSATRESKYIEFKGAFSPAAPGEWCELIKDIVALANSGGGILVFGLDSLGRPTGESPEAIAGQDPADILNKVTIISTLKPHLLRLRALH